jgi:hypothetical protein
MFFNRQKTHVNPKTTQHSQTEDQQESDLPNVPHLTPANIMRLQSTIGNQATQRVLRERGMIQRLPTADNIQSDLKPPKAKSTQYRPVIAALKAFNDFVNGKLGNTLQKVQDDFAQIKILFDAVIQSTGNYVQKKGKKIFTNKKKLNYMKSLYAQAIQEKQAALIVLLDMSSNFQSYAPLIGTMTYKMAIQTKLPSMIQLDGNQATGTQQGGMNVVSQFNVKGKTNYFKETTASIDLATTEKKYNAVSEEMTAYEQTSNFDSQNADYKKKGKEANVLSNAIEMPKLVGIEHSKLNSANRDLAMYRLDQLLGADIIAPTQLALRKVGKESQLGSLMEGAQGQAAGRIALTQAQLADPNFQRLMSRLQILDTLAFQVDRHQGNYYLQMDNTGNIIDITGIDNDMAFGTKTSLTSSAKEYPRISEFVDEEIALRIINLPVELIQWIVEDLLDPAEVSALVTRLKALQIHLKALKDSNKLLKPNQWNQATAKGVFNEDASYFRKLTNDNKVAF